MKVTKVEITNFRNLEEISFMPYGSINVFLGKNGHGKTNTLEAIRIGLCAASHRANSGSELIKKDASFLRVRLEAVTDDGISHETVFTYSVDSNRKDFILDEKRVKTRSELFSQFPNVFFGPDEIRLIKDGPSLRRDYMDEALTFLYSDYQDNLKRYYKALKDRNMILKNYKMSDDILIDSYDDILVTSGSRIMQYRVRLINAIAPGLKRVHEYLTSGKDSITIDYMCDVVEHTTGDKLLSERYKQLLVDSRRDDILRKTTTRGIHKDDISIKVNELDAKDYASQGQQRSIALCMKLALIDLFKEKTGNTPVIFLDDITGELDTSRREKLIEMLSGYQCFVTATELNIDEKIGSARYYDIDSGHIV